MRIDDLATRIRIGEDARLALKEVSFEDRSVSAPRREQLADELAALANSKGGVLALGVSPATRRVTGIPLDRLDTVQDIVQKVCTDSIQPPLEAGIYRHELEASLDPRLDEPGISRPILVIEVPQSSLVHQSPGGYFHRIGKSKHQIESMALQRLMIRRAHSGVPRFDERPVPWTKPEDLERSAAERFVSEEPDFDVAVRKQGLIVEDADCMSRLSLAGALVCTEEPQRWIQEACIQAVLYAGDRADEHYLIDAQEIRGPLDAQVNGAFAFVRRNMRIGAVKRLGRVEVPQYSETAVFEALVNAVAHRDYSIAGSTIRLLMFSDRIEFYVPGGLVGPLTTDVLHLRQVNRNPLIVSLLARCPSPAGSPRQLLMDKRGDGVPKIRSETQRLTGRLPGYSLVSDSELRLVLPAAAPF